MMRVDMVLTWWCDPREDSQLTVLLRPCVYSCWPRSALWPEPSALCWLKEWEPRPPPGSCLHGRGLRLHRHRHRAPRAAGGPLQSLAVAAGESWPCCSAWEWWCWSRVRVRHARSRVWEKKLGRETSAGVSWPLETNSVLRRMIALTTETEWMRESKRHALHQTNMNGSLNHLGLETPCASVYWCRLREIWPLHSHDASSVFAGALVFQSVDCFDRNVI